MFYSVITLSTIYCDYNSWPKWVLYHGDGPFQLLFYVMASRTILYNLLVPIKLKKKFWPPELLNLKSFGCAGLDVIKHLFWISFIAATTIDIPTSFSTPPPPTTTTATTTTSTTTTTTAVFSYAGMIREDTKFWIPFQQNWITKPMNAIRHGGLVR